MEKEFIKWMFEKYPLQTVFVVVTVVGAVLALVISFF